MAQQSRLAIPLNWRSLSQDEDLAAVRWGDCRARFAQLMAESPSPRRDINAVLAAHDRQLLDSLAFTSVFWRMAKRPASK